MELRVSGFTGALNFNSAWDGAGLLEMGWGSV